MNSAVALGLTFFAVVSPLFGAGDDTVYATEIKTWQAERVASLTKPTGWLSLIGLHFLQPGENRLGTAADNTIVLAAGPAALGTVTLTPEGKALFTAAAEVTTQIDGQPARTGELLSGTAKPTVVSAGTVSFFVIERGGRKALRVRDSESDRRKHFLGIDTFPIDPSWRIEAQWVPFAEPKEITIQNIIGNVSQEKVPGKAVFTRDGRTFELLPIIEGPDEPLFFVIADETSGKETYGAARFVYADLPKDGKVLLDFNKAENPPCAFTPFATCPLPPKENRLKLAITAGEKNYRGAAH
jgi:uncharacterized protein (DUF1684 family)